MQNFFNNYFQETINSIKNFNKDDINNLAKSIAKIRLNKGRIFFVGVGGSAGNATHAVNDFRKLCNVECYSITDNASELTARINDEGWDSSFSEWLKISNLNKKDAIFVLSVGGGNIERKVSVNIVNAVKYAKFKRAKIFGIVSRDGGYTKKIGDNVVVIPVKEKKLVTPISEALQAVVWHYLVSSSYLKKNKTKW
ncbi:SIS domain-containing protein [Candidatus Pelagibacter communis]|uniref:SIS domain-containing protein n=1 Tax=Pelagibacter ubique TaxID=198252 RepID=UPI00065B4349|nr:SIS domain-containing protein [Candidatus Pelagibacter ubique]